jgi:hypothetical protein
MGVEFEGWWEVAGMAAVFGRLKIGSCIVVKESIFRRLESAGNPVTSYQSLTKNPKPINSTRFEFTKVIVR